MDPAGNECIPQQVSLLEAYMENPERIAAAPAARRIRTAPRREEAADAEHAPLEDAEQLLRTLSMFRMLDADELAALARSARPLALGPLERFAIQGTAGTSLFVVADGEVEVIVRRAEGPDLKVATLGRGEVIGEMSLLTGEPRCGHRPRRRRRPCLRDRPASLRTAAAHAPRVGRRAGDDHGGAAPAGRGRPRLVRRADATTRSRPSHRPAFLLGGRRRALRGSSGRLSRSVRPPSRHR